MFDDDVPSALFDVFAVLVPACCSSWIADNVSSYLRWSLPLKKEKIRICRSVRIEVVMKCEPVGEKVSEFGNDFV